MYFFSISLWKYSWLTQLVSEKITWYGGNFHTVGDQKWTGVCKGDRGGRLTDGKENGENWVFLYSRNPLFFPSSHTSISIAIFSSYLLLEDNLNVFFLVFPLLLRSLPWLSSVLSSMIKAFTFLSQYSYYLCISILSITKLHDLITIIKSKQCWWGCREIFL